MRRELLNEEMKLNGKKALIAMSGGVDSSVSAYLTLKAGYSCIGVTMHLYDKDDVCDKNTKTCCSYADIDDAGMVAASLGIEFRIMEFKKEFKEKVINRFIEEYENCRTPNPCIDCNKYMKFDLLLNKADELGCDKIVTGHYAVIEQDGKTGKYVLKKAADESKDQSYVLYGMTQDILARTLFPLGKMKKSETRKIAEKLNFVNAEKHDSQDICFVPGGDYVAAIKKINNKTYPKGNFIDLNGNILGQHNGIISYTVGQRKGLGIALGEPAYVISKNKENNTVTLGKNEDLFTSSLTANNVNWISGTPDPAGKEIKAKIRYNQKEQPAVIAFSDKSSFSLEFKSPQRAVTPGQSCVLYDGETVIGGGIIQ